MVRPPEVTPGKRIPLCRVMNVVATVSLGSTIDLEKLAMNNLNIEYNKKRFAAATLRLYDPYDGHCRTTALLYTTGKAVCTGAKSIPSAFLACRRYVDYLQGLGEDVEYIEPRIQNIVIVAYCRYLVNLRELAFQYSRYSDYQPELFPGLFYRDEKLGAVFIVFRMGKVVGTGAKDYASMTRAWTTFYTQVLSKMKDTKGGPTSSSEYRTLTEKRDSASKIVKEINKKVLREIEDITTGGTSEKSAATKSILDSIVTFKKGIVTNSGPTHNRSASSTVQASYEQLLANSGPNKFTAALKIVTAVA